jgi:hypothetical protein
MRPRWLSVLISLIALFLAVGGTGLALVTAGGSQAVIRACVE